MGIRLTNDIADIAAIAKVRLPPCHPKNRGHFFVLDYSTASPFWGRSASQYCSRHAASVASAASSFSLIPLQISGLFTLEKFFLQLHKTDRAEIFVKKLFQLRAFPGQTIRTQQQSQESFVT